MSEVELINLAIQAFLSAPTTENRRDDWACVVKTIRNAVIEECAGIANELWLDGVPISEIADRLRALKSS